MRRMYLVLAESGVYLPASSITYEYVHHYRVVGVDVDARGDDTKVGPESVGEGDDAVLLLVLWQRPTKSIATESPLQSGTGRG